MPSGKRWTVHDRDGNPIYLTEERWQHIISPDNHPELADCEAQLRLTLQRARRRQEALNPRKYRYAFAFDDLPGDFSHVVAIVLFGFDDEPGRGIVANNYVATAFLKHMMIRGGR